MPVVVEVLARRAHQCRTAAQDSYCERHVARDSATVDDQIVDEEAQ